MLSRTLLLFSLVALAAHYDLARPYERNYPYGVNIHDRSDMSSPFAFRGTKSAKRSFGNIHHDPFSKKIDESFILANVGGSGQEEDGERNQYDVINEARLGRRGNPDVLLGPDNRRQGSPRLENNLKRFNRHPQPHLPSAHSQGHHSQRLKKSHSPIHGSNSQSFNRPPFEPEPLTSDFGADYSS